MHYDKDFSMECRIARFHNIFGPYGTWKGGREKAPAAFCRKVRLAHPAHLKKRKIKQQYSSGPEVAFEHIVDW